MVELLVGSVELLPTITEELGVGDENPGWGGGAITPEITPLLAAFIPTIKEDLIYRMT